MCGLLDGARALEVVEVRSGEPRTRGVDLDACRFEGGSEGERSSMDSPFAAWPTPQLQTCKLKMSGEIGHSSTRRVVMIVHFWTGWEMATTTFVRMVSLTMRVQRGSCRSRNRCAGQLIV